ncbi:uncharacterized protein LOC111888886 [Lactuca sativa]|nr:uncharacterized protein LOC111888886 [Lactuca sativa]XP_052624717.1 uncharacterized protein LOC111888886 [Lactuca sativa]
MNILYQKQNIEAILTKNTISGYVSYGGLRSCIVDLLYGLLKFDPEERPSAEEALDNPFFRNTHAMLNSRSWNNGQISKDDHGSVDMAPRPSYNFTPDAKLGKILLDQSSVLSESELTPCSTSFSSIASNATPN